MIATRPDSASALDFHYLPAYADYLLGHIEDFVGEQIALSRQLDVPILRYFQGWPEEQFLRFSIETSKEFLQYFSENRAADQIEVSLKRWTENQLPSVARDHVAADDITLINYVRKQAFLKFLPRFSSDMNHCLNIIGEIDRYVVASERASFKTFFQIQLEKEKEIASKLIRSEEMLLEAQSLAGIGSFDWNLESDEANITPQLRAILEIENNRLDEFMSHVHPDDVMMVRAALHEALNKTGVYDKEFRYRVNGKEKVLWSRGQVHYNHERPLSMTGTVMDVTQRHELISRLQEGEKLFKQAQALTHLGNYIWNLETNLLFWSDEMYRLYGLSPGEPLSYETVAGFNHPDDVEYVKTEIQKAISSGREFNFFYRIITRNREEKILFAKGEIVFQDDKPSKVIGTAQDVTTRQNLIRRLQESEALYKEAQSISHVGNWTMNLETRRLQWSEEMFKIYGIPSEDEITFEAFLEMIYPPDRNKVLYHTNKCIESGKDYDLVHRIRLSDGTLKTVHRKGRIEFDSKGEPIKMVGTTQDITQYKKIEKELLDSRNFIQKVADAMPAIVATYNINTGEYRFISGGLKKLLGYEPERGMKEGIAFFSSIIHPEDFKRLMQENEAALRLANEQRLNQDVIEFSYRMRHRDGQYRWFQTFGTIFDRNSEGHVEHVLNISIDITERMEAEKKIAEQEYFISQIIDASPTILYLFAVRPGHVLYINREIENVLGYKPEEILLMGNQVINELYHPADAVEMGGRLKLYNNLENPRSLFQFECRMKNKDGDWRFMLIREIVFRRNDEGKVTELLGSALDITPRKIMEEKLFHQTIELQHSNTSLEEFAYVASHDLKEPLRKITTFGDRLLASHSGSWQGSNRDYLEKMVSSARRMQLMINDLLSISMISGNKQFERHSLKSIVDDVRQSLEHKIEESNATIDVSDLPDADIVPSQFRQLFQNLISNSLKFVKPGISPVIKINHTFLNSTETISLKLAKAKRQLKIEITDNGIGFENEFSDKIFSIFQRLHGRSSYEGTGIGLAICKKIVENHGGVISAKGVVNQGSTFTIIIPV